jgi:hypothetical protein
MCVSVGVWVWECVYVSVNMCVHVRVCVQKSQKSHKNLKKIKKSLFFLKKLK